MTDVFPSLSDKLCVRGSAFTLPQIRWPQRDLSIDFRRQPWVVLDAGTPAFDGYYDAAKLWPSRSLMRYAEAKALKKVNDSAALRRRRS
jgi:hypothetical protein